MHMSFQVYKTLFDILSMKAIIEILIKKIVQHLNYI